MLSRMLGSSEMLGFEPPLHGVCFTAGRLVVPKLHCLLFMTSLLQHEGIECLHVNDLYIIKVMLKIKTWKLSLNQCFMTP